MAKPVQQEETKSPDSGEWREFIDFGSLRRVTPVSRSFGFERGQPIDRYYIEGFLRDYADDIRAHVLEIGDPTYTRQFGREQVTESDVLDAKPDNSIATIQADLTHVSQVPSDAFDCIICCQTLQFIYDLQKATTELHRLLKSGGVLLVTVPAISQIVREDMDREGDYWRFTDASIARLLGDVFGAESITVQSYGNVLAAIGFLHGLSVSDFNSSELNAFDRDYPLVVAARAVKA